MLTMQIVHFISQGGRTSEGEEGERDRDGHVDAHHADLHLVLKLARRRPAGSEQRGAVTVGVGVDDGDGIVQCLCLQTHLRKIRLHVH